jgi:hypothetical protein
MREVTIPPGFSFTPTSLDTGGIEFDPLAVGTTLVSATLPGFIATTAASVNVTVEPTGISMFGLGSGASVGAGLQTNSPAGAGLFARLEGSEHGGVTIRIRSTHPGLALVSPDATTPGTSFFDVFVPNGSTDVSYYVQGVENAIGAVTITAHQVGDVVIFGFGTQGNLEVVEPGLQIVGLETSIGAIDPSDPFTVQVGLPDVHGNFLTRIQEVRAGLTLVANVTNSNAAIAQLVTLSGGAQARSVQIAAVQSTSPHSVAEGGIELDALETGDGDTLVEATIPGFLTTLAGRVTVTVTP